MERKTLLPLWIGLGLAIGVFVGSKLNFGDTTEKIFATNSKKDKLNRLIDYIDYEYVDNVNTDSIVDVTVNRILENLDPHSVYIPKSEYAHSADDMRGNFMGVGISFYIYRDTIAVIRPVSGGPAESAGIKSGDRILYADGKRLFGEFTERDSIVDYLKGEKNSCRNTFSLRRRNATKPASRSWPGSVATNPASTWWPECMPQDHCHTCRAPSNWPTSAVPWKIRNLPRIAGTVCSQSTGLTRD